jgi:hypothetical protein
MALSKAQTQQIAQNVFASALGWLAYDSLGLFAKHLSITSAQDKKELLSLIIKVTSARDGKVRYQNGTEFKALVGIVIHPQFDAVPFHLVGKPWTLLWPSGIQATFNIKKFTWE